MNSTAPTSRRPAPVRALLILALAPWAGLVAAPVFTTAVSRPNAPSTSTDEVTFASDASASDLLHGIQGSGGLWNANGSSPDGLNDGVHGGDYDTAGLPALNGAAWARDGDRVSFREFELGGGPTGAGFDIQSLQSIAAWQGAGFPNQRYEVRVRRIGETGFPAAPLLTVDYQPFPASPNNNGGSTLVPNNRALGRNVSVVDQYAPFLTNPADLTSINQSLISNGINHPDNIGYGKMAQVWFAGIEALGLGPDTFERWIGGFPGVGVRNGFDDDADDDGVPNGLEYHFGTAPDAFSGGLIPGVKTGNTFTFTHPQPDTPARSVAAAYRWSKDLTSFHAHAATDADGTTVTISTQPGTPAAGTTTVTATVTGTPAARLFLDIEAEPN